MTEKKKVLIVEDERPVLDALTKAIDEAGFEAIPVTNGQEGLDSGKEKKPDIVILDVIMPKMHGVEMYKSMRREEWGSSIPVIFLTNYSEDPRLEEFSGKDHCELLSKNEVKLAEVIEIIKKHLA